MGQGFAESVSFLGIILSARVTLRRTGRQLLHDQPWLLGMSIEGGYFHAIEGGFGALKVLLGESAATADL